MNTRTRAPETAPQPDNERLLTELDFVRLDKHRSQHPSKELDELLELADLVPSDQIPPDVVTMNSRIVLQDPQAEHAQEWTLCYPGDAQPDQGALSVFSPMGASLLGHRCGDLAFWTLPNGQQGQARITAIPYQPEASGDLTR